MSGTITIANGDYILDDEGRYIGTVGSSATVGSDTVITTSSAAYATNGNAYFSGAGLKVTVADDEFKSHLMGHGSTDTFVAFNKEIHMLRSAAINHAENAGGTSDGYGGSGEELILNMALF